MEISKESGGGVARLRLKGRLDAGWCPVVEQALAEAVRTGEHQVHVDLSEVSYISSAGLRVLMSTARQLRAIQGRLSVVDPSEAVRVVLDQTGLLGWLAPGDGHPSTALRPGAAFGRSSASVRCEAHRIDGRGIRLSGVGDPAWAGLGLGRADGMPCRLGTDQVALGVGALGAGAAEAGLRGGEFLAVAGAAAFQPTDGSPRPDYLVTQGGLVPEGHLLAGLLGCGSFTELLRFDVLPEARTVGLAELAGLALEAAGTESAVVVALADSAGLVGATLRQPPVRSAAGEEPPGGSRLAFPAIRDWLSYPGERVHRDGTALVVGVVGRPGSRLGPYLRPLGREVAALGHFHAAIFPYRPLPKGRLELVPAVAALFEGPPVQAVLHLLADTRGRQGAGESEFHRGALWLAPVLDEP